MPRHAAGLKLVIRPDTGALTIVGTVNRTRVRQSAKSANPTLAREECIALEKELLRTAWHGERRGVRLFWQALDDYIAKRELINPLSAATKARLKRILDALGPTITLGEIDEIKTIALLKRKLLRADAGPQTVVREIISPLRPVLTFAAKRGWCDMVFFDVPRWTESEITPLLPAEAERLIAAAAPHLQPLLIFSLCTGARLSEALELDWRDVDLVGARVILWRTKNGKRRDVPLPPRAVAALAGIADQQRLGPVFRWQDRTGRWHDYADHQRRSGGQIRRGWQGAMRRAGLAGFTVHGLRHSWASWRYALNPDALRLKAEGGWSSSRLVERYAHLLPGGHEAAIRQFWEGKTDAARRRG